MGRPKGSTNKPKVSGAAIYGEMLDAELGPNLDAKKVGKKKTVRIDPSDQARLEEESDMLYVPPEIIPEGMRYNWKTYSVLGQVQSRRFGRFQTTGWEAVPASRHPGLFTPHGYEGMIEYDGLVLCEKPEELCRQTEAREFMKARGQVQTKEQQLRGGNIEGVSLDARHQSAIKSNRINKSYERFDIPE